MSEAEVSEMSDEVVCTDWVGSMEGDATIERSSEILSAAVEQPEIQVSVIMTVNDATHSKRIILTIRATSQTLKSGYCNLYRQRYMGSSGTLPRWVFLNELPRNTADINFRRLR